MPISLKSHALTKACFSHGFSTRALDLQLGAEGHRESLLRFGEDTGIDVGRLGQAKQVHGVVTLMAEEALAARERGGPWHEADAIVATMGFAAGVRIADCVPILGGDPESGVAVAIHAGWKGAVAGVIRSALSRFAEHGGKPERSVFAIGPCICSACFEVGEDVAERIGQTCGADVIVRPSNEPRPRADLRRGVRALLEREGARVIEDVPGCTRCDENLFYSYRRDKDPSGRQLAAIAAR